MDDRTMSNQREDAAKRPYAKPQIQQVPLRPEEAVLGGCKSMSVSGPAQGMCNSPAVCSAAGS